MEECNLITANLNQTDEIYNLVQETIKTVYPKYYASGVVNFFCQHHSVEKIRDDIQKGFVYVVVLDEKIVATGTLDGNHITRVFVKPEYQGQGIGSFIFDTFEKKIFAHADFVELDASLAAAVMYEKRGYKTVRHETTDCENGSILVYEVLQLKNKGENYDK